MPESPPPLPDARPDGQGLRWLLLALGLAFALRLAGAFYWEARFAQDGFHFGDSQSYWTLARAIADGQPYEYGPGGPKVFRTPGYPVLLAPLFLLFDDDPPIILARVQAVLLGTLTVLGVWLLAHHLFDRRTADLAAIVAAVYPGLIAMSLPVLAEAPFCGLIPFQLLLWVRAWQAESRSNCLFLALATGILGAGIALIRPSWLLFMPFAIGLGLAFGRPKARHALVGIGIMVGLVVGMAPWWMRNAKVTGHFVPTSLQVGASLYDGWNPRATGASDMYYVADFEMAEREAEANQLSGVNRSELFEYRLDRRMRDAAVAWACDNPGQVVRLAAVKFTRIWNIWPNEPVFSKPLVRLVVAVTFVPLLILGLIGVYQAMRRGWPYVLCFLPAVYLTSLHMVFIGSIRYREPAMIGFIVLAAAVVMSWRVPANRRPKNREVELS